MLLDFLRNSLKDNEYSKEWSDILFFTLDNYKINSKNRILHFLSQVYHESNYLQKLEENLNYSSKRLLEEFPRYFKDIETANKCNYNPEKIANIVYASRIGNGNEKSGDGYRYRGRGAIQLTGKENYAKFSQDIFGNDMILNNPDQILQDKILCIKCACWFWQVNDLNKYADGGIANIKIIRKKINGGDNGLDDVINIYYKLEKIF